MATEVKVKELKVYVRKVFRKPKKQENQETPAQGISKTLIEETPSLNSAKTLTLDSPSVSNEPQKDSNEAKTLGLVESEPAPEGERASKAREPQEGSGGPLERQECIDVGSEDDSSPGVVLLEKSGGGEVRQNGGVVWERGRPVSGFSRLDDNLVSFDVLAKSKQEVREFKQKLTDELYKVRNFVKGIEGAEMGTSLALGVGVGGNVGVDENGNGYESVRSQLTSPKKFSHLSQLSSPKLNQLASPKFGLTPVFGNGGGSAKRAHSEVGSVGGHEGSRPFHRQQLSISVMENNHHGGGLNGGEVLEREKRTPKANQFYQSSEFILGKDKLPSESNKKSKTISGRKHGHGGGLGGGDGGYKFGMEKPSSQVYKNCNSILSKLMKHKHGWVFNTPVNAQALGLHDYFVIIRHPMDLGTVKANLTKYWYKTPKEFAEDVRLTFRNAMTYNPPGQDVHVMAQQLSDIFEDRWIVIERDLEYLRESRLSELEKDYGLPTPTSKITPIPPFHRISDRSESMQVRPAIVLPPPRVPVLKKPKAKDLNKREMTYEEKQKLSNHLENLPPEKLENIVQIINKRNPKLSLQGDEIEVDIDVVDTETLWELDRFVTNFKKSVSKYKRRNEIAQGKELARKTQVTNQGHTAGSAPKETKAAEKSESFPSLQGEKLGGPLGIKSSSSSSSSSGSSSSDSDSDSSSASESVRSPKT